MPLLTDVCEGVEDMIQLQNLHEGSLLHNLHLRYQQRKIYTYTVRVCINMVSFYISLGMCVSVCVCIVCVCVRGIFPSLSGLVFVFT